MKHSLFATIILTLFFYSCTSEKVKIQIIETTDVHGRFFNYDFATDTQKNGSMGQVAQYIKQQRQQNGEILLLDNGDILQGTPTAYYSNFVDTVHKNIMVRILGDLHYDAATVGNHDIETGPKVYNKVKEELSFPWLGANIIDIKTGKPAFRPYTIVEKKGVKIAILGILTPGIPNWLPHKLYKGLEFADMVETAEKWMPEIKKNQPDIIIGLFHAGLNPAYGGFKKGAYKNPNATLRVAKEVPGFDIVFAGHDHRRTIKKVVNTENDTVTVINGGSHAKWIGSAELVYDNKNKRIESITPQIVDLSQYKTDKSYESKYGTYLDSVKNYFKEPVGWLGTELCPQEALFGPSAFMQFIHQVQLSATNARVSLSAPLQIYTCIDTGTIYRSDIFALYRYENYLAEMNMTAGEIDRFLEHGVSSWFNTMQNKSDNLLNYNEEGHLDAPYYNFSSALGVHYKVDVTQKPGNRVTITQVDGKIDFKTEDTVRVALNSYRMVGGGGHMPDGTGIDLETLKERNVLLSEVPIKNIMMKYFNNHDSVWINTEINWHLTPEKWTKQARQKEIQNF
ncbi:Trifunctional nucleotide phosphoesterase protein YfkN precursor [Salinivirga cyanobacteriivorans]|uniref:Trifunctional nucleotide phosphoesterase protein YfkN n=1 Tax=Salinivirga cyanobacteriivorans TaxID=1307839 RepID=A0A0S2HX33_9BACT|nr:bifunctional metallophosphatase/5'-nucleotidase [Salinivirga cyanobacteriivorans]ALO14578.1 Trifunctional nucleotide phosphoesterase protein YfkN precursor [Salinivirga cyanobacteriivorans]